MLNTEKIELIEKQILEYEETFQVTKANRCRSKLEFILYMENRLKPPSDGPKCQPKYNEY